MSTVNTMRQREADLKRIALLLRCPMMGTQIELSYASDGSLVSCKSSVSDHIDGVDYPIVSNQPVLVDFSNSVLDRESVITSGAESLVRRKVSPVHAIFHRWVFGENSKAERNARKLLNQLCKQTDRRPLILIIGGGTIGKGANELYACTEVDVVAFDIYGSQYTTFIADAHTIPLSNASVDAVWIQAVLEHVLDPHRVVSEIHRVLVPSGLVYAETPFLQAVHESAFDFTRFTESGHRWLFRHFQLIESGVIAGPGTTVFWSLRYLFAGLLRSRSMGTIVALPFFWLRLLDRFVDKHFASDAANGVYFLGRRAKQELEPAEIISFFKGVQ